MTNKYIKDGIFDEKFIGNSPFEAGTGMYVKEVLCDKTSSYQEILIFDRYVLPAFLTRKIPLQPTTYYQSSLHLFAIVTISLMPSLRNFVTSCLKIAN